MRTDGDVLMRCGMKEKDQSGKKKLVRILSVLSADVGY